MIQSGADRAMNLRHATQTVSILHAWIVFEMRLSNLAISQQLSQMRRDFDLSRMRSSRMNTLVESYGRTFQRFERHRAGNVGQTDESFRSMQRKRADCSHRLRAVKKRESFFHFQLQRRNLRALESGCRW